MPIWYIIDILVMIDREEYAGVVDFLVKYGRSYRAQSNIDIGGEVWYYSSVLAR